ncbi:sterol-binding protein [Intrasporangium oryzae NRRL B-24470]|uniref:Sterol-binding protein n=1 Tax=Intrasporangium oryzae NRRL B-24470 TaxID=1386089 RepID=W9G1N8_9MICO|nr:SCP2 sterol-binding domain-containing protein [Intrasporangium oryzae]EWS99874.1 sterol-binding protein [Intrasporangium oryzae NRRL B-24470]
MTSTHEFFDDLARRGHDPLLGRVTADVRFDLVGSGETEHILVRIDHGDITVSAEDAPAQCVVSGDRALLDAIVDGGTSIMTALLRGELAVDGDPELLVLTQRLFPGRVAGSRSEQAARERRSP